LQCLKDSTPKGAKLPSILKNDQIDFAQGPYAQYYWELFFHTPILIAKNLSNQNKFEEAIDWLGHIFNPSKKRKHITPTTFHDKAPKKINEVVSATIFKTKGHLHTAGWQGFHRLTIA
jgi:hypothetical protein